MTKKELVNHWVNKRTIQEQHLGAVKILLKAILIDDGIGGELIAEVVAINKAVDDAIKTLQEYSKRDLNSLKRR